MHSQTHNRPFRAEQVPTPSAPPCEASLWSSGANIDLEIGAGVGWHAISYTQKHPDRTLIAIEHTQSRFQRLQGRASAHGYPGNLIPVHANAIHWVAHHVPASSLSRIWLLFPNPYPKPKQRNLRWHGMPFRDFLIERLKPGGLWIMATNVNSYAEEALAVLGRHPLLRCVETLRYGLDTSPWQPRTHFEKKYLARGDTCTQVTWQRVPSGTLGGQ